MEFNHIPVLFHETIDSLQIKPDGVYIDGTAGGGGHSQAILDRLTTGTLLSIDQDPDAVSVVTHRFAGNPCSVVRRANFSEMARVAHEAGLDRVDGVLLDEPYIREPMDDVTSDPNRTQTHFEVPEGEIFVMGDNRNNSDDSRDIRIGSIDEDYVLGKAVFSLLPFDTIGPL